MSQPLCNTCGTQLDEADNFCRQCGVARSQVPVIRRTSVPTLWQPQVSPVVKGAAVMAAGTIGQFMFRRMVSGLLGRGPKRSRAIKIRQPKGDDGMVDEAQVITETIMMRRVRIRRQA